MSFDSWLAAVFALASLGLAMHGLVTGRVYAAGVRIERRNDHSGYWLGFGFLIVSAVIFCGIWFRSATAELARFPFELPFATYWLYLIIEALRAGEIHWGKNPVSRRDRAKVYWTVLLFYGLVLAVFASAVIYL